MTVPADPSSASFLVVAALITEGSDLTIKNVGMNPARIGLFETLLDMGGQIYFENKRQSCGEDIADIHVKYSKLKGNKVPHEREQTMIDEYPVLAVAAAHAEGTTIMRGAAELRVKESDRVAATVAGLQANGVQVEELDDGMAITGAPREVAGGGTDLTHMDHRIAMSFLPLGLGAKKPVIIDEGEMIATSFPD